MYFVYYQNFHKLGARNTTNLFLQYIQVQCRFIFFEFLRLSILSITNVTHVNSCAPFMFCFNDSSQRLAVYVEKDLRIYEFGQHDSYACGNEIGKDLLLYYFVSEIHCDEFICYYHFSIPKVENFVYTRCFLQL